MLRRLANVHWLWLSLLVILADQASKLLVVRSLQKFAVVPLVGHLNLVRMQNTGAAFSMFRGAPAAAFIGLGAGVSLVIVWWLRRHPFDHRLVAAALALILGGAMGNAIDRAWRGSVVDFVDFYVGAWHFAAFNLADSAITLGAGLLILDMLLESRRSARQAAAGSSPPRS